MEEKIMNLNQIKPNDLLVIPRWGVGKCQGWQTIESDDYKEKVLAIYFYSKKLTAYFPKGKISTVKARSLSSLAEIERCLSVLKSKKPNLRQNWIATLKSYNQKLHSGELQKLAELIRDTLIESKKQYDQNFTKREIHNAAIDLWAHEIMLVQNISYEQARAKIKNSMLQSQ